MLFHELSNLITKSISRRPLEEILRCLTIDKEHALSSKLQRHGVQFAAHIFLPKASHLRQV
jgi:hypothetical protein